MKSILKLLLLLIVGVVLALNAVAAKPEGCTAKRDDTKLADFGKSAMPIAALTISLAKKDWLGAALSQALAHGLYPLNDKLESKIGKKRPCGCNGAFPSGHMIMYASSSSYLHYRYGWEYGLPAYVATIVFAADRVNNKAHSWGDMIGTFAIVNIFTYLVTPKYVEERIILGGRVGGLSDPQTYLEYAAKKSPTYIPSLQVSGKNFLAGVSVKL